MASYEITSCTVRPVEGDDQIEVVLLASDGSKWEYGIPYSRSTGRYQFEEIDVAERDVRQFARFANGGDRCNKTGAVEERNHCGAGRVRRYF